ncbi:MAG: ABC transporter permease [Bacteroidales bacterium]|nr:ABC transporter permease [Bacteroidales bacterium]
MLKLSDKVAAYFSFVLRKGNLSVVFWMTFVSVWLGTTVLLFSFAIIRGFKQEIIHKISGFSSHFTIVAASTSYVDENPPLSLYRIDMETIRKMQEIKYAAPFVVKSGVIKTDSSLWGIIFKGISVQYDWSFFEKNLFKGQIPNFRKDSLSNEIMLSKTICQKLRLDIDSPVRVYFQVPGDNTPRGRRFRLVGIFHTGFEDFDRYIGFCDMRQLQRLNKWHDSLVSGIEILLKNFKTMDEMKEKINAVIPYDLQLEDVREKHAQFFDWLSALDTNVNILLILMSIVVFVNMLALLLVIVFKHIPMIGLFKAMGAHPSFLRKVFTLIILRVTIPSLGLANLFTIIIILLQQHFRWIPLNEEMYYLDYVPMIWQLDYFVFVNLLIMFVVLLCLILPLQIIRGISPSKALTYR